MSLWGCETGMTEALNHLKVLVVDDVMSARRIVVRMLRGIGFELVTEAENGESAFEKCRLQKFDVVISDLHLGDTTGSQLIERIRSMHPSSHFVLITGESDAEMLREIEMNDIAVLLPKPFNRDALKDALSGVLKGS